ncbi:MAG: rod shape-determining protein MreC, partial [bacterium]|nr:rod shape-determining protein MreC [bacterium]
ESEQVMNRASGEISTERKHFVLVMILFLNLVLVSTNVVLKNQRTLFQTVVGFIVSPFQIVFQETIDFISHEFNHYVFLKDSFTKYNEIKKEYTRLKYENYMLRRKLTEQGFVWRVKDNYGEFIKADVISIDRNFPLNSLMINCGTRDGIVKDMIVLNEDGELVGKIVEPVTLLSAKVRLITSSIGGVGAYIEKNKLEGFLTGDNSPVCRFKYLIENKPVFKDDRIVSSGTDEIFPPYIGIGKVVKVEKEYLTQNVFVKPFFIEKSIKQLIVIKKE